MRDAGRPTRNRILDAALDLFGTRGVEAVSLDDIAAEVGVRKQTVLYWFPSKDDLLDAVLAATPPTELGGGRSRPPSAPRRTIRSTGSTPWCGRCSAPPCAGRRCSAWSARSAGSPEPQAERLRGRVQPLVDARSATSPPRWTPGRLRRGDPGLVAALGLRHGDRHRHRARGAARRRLAARPPPACAGSAPSSAPSSAPPSPRLTGSVSAWCCGGGGRGARRARLDEPVDQLAGYDSPLACHSFGYIEIGVNPGIVLTSLHRKPRPPSS